MSDASQEVRRIRWSECFGFMHLFQAFRLSTSHTSLILAFCGLAGMYATGHILDAVWPEDSKPAVMQGVSELERFVESDAGGRTATLRWIDVQQADPEAAKPQRVGAFFLFTEHVRASIYQATDAVLGLRLGSLLHTVRRGLMAFVWLPAMHPLYAILFTLVTLVIWAWFGGAICRHAAMRVTREERLDLRASLRFARQRLLSLIAAPIMPLGVLAGAALAFLGLGAIFLIPVLGELAQIMLFGLALLIGFALAVVVVCWIPGIPLMYPTIAMEGSDAFDAVSRSWSYIQQRPWRAAFFGLVSLFYGAICLVFVKFFARLLLWFTHLGLSVFGNYGHVTAEGPDGATQEIAGKLDGLWQGPKLFGATPFWGDFGGHDLTGMSAFGQWVLWIWVMIVVGFVGAFAVNFFFSSCTLIYGLLRREVDATDIDDIYLEEPEEDEMPLGGPSEPQQKDDGSGDTSLPVIGQ